MASNVTTPNQNYIDLAPMWSMIANLMGGTDAMLKAGKVSLPQHPKETDDVYKNRLTRATLAPFFRLSVSNLVGRIFAKPIAMKEDVPDQIATWCENIDRQGNHANVFFVKMSQEAISKGSAFVLIDYPKVLNAPTLADERQQNVRPYATFYTPESVIDTRIDESGKLTDVRLKENIIEPDGEFGTKTVEQIRRIRRTGDGVQYQLWRCEKNTGKWMLTEEGPMTIDEIPLVALYTNLQGPQYSPPPLLDLAYLCIKHWQDQSEQDNVTEVARFPMLAASGISEEDAKKMAIGPHILLAGAAEAKFYYVEHTGTAIAAGRAELERLEDQIAMEGTRPLTRQRTANGATATQVESEDRSIKSEAQVWSKNITDAIEKCLQLMAKWMGLGDNKGGSVSLEGDFDVVGIDAVSMSQLQQMRSSEDLSRLTLWEEMKRRGVLADDFDPNLETARMNEEGPPADSIETMMESMKRAQKKPEEEKKIDEGMDNGGAAE